jgi:hypothetical protein
MSAQTLAEFLNELAGNAEMLETFNSSQTQAVSMMNTAGLTEQEQTAILEHDVPAIYDLLSGTDRQQMMVPFGPVRGPGPVRLFAVTLDPQAAAPPAQRPPSQVRPKKPRTRPSKKKATGRSAGKAARKKTKKKK